MMKCLLCRKVIKTGAHVVKSELGIYDPPDGPGQGGDLIPLDDVGMAHVECWSKHEDLPVVSAEGKKSKAIIPPDFGGRG